MGTCCGQLGPLSMHSCSHSWQMCCSSLPATRASTQQGGPEPGEGVGGATCHLVPKGWEGSSLKSPTLPSPSPLTQLPSWALAVPLLGGVKVQVQGFPSNSELHINFCYCPPHPYPHTPSPPPTPCMTTLLGPPLATWDGNPSFRGRFSCQGASSAGIGTY